MAVPLIFTLCLFGGELDRSLPNPAASALGQIGLMAREPLMQWFLIVSSAVNFVFFTDQSDRLSDQRGGGKGRTDPDLAVAIAVAANSSGRASASEPGIDIPAFTQEQGSTMHV